MVRETIESMARKLREHGHNGPVEVNITTYGYQLLLAELRAAGEEFSEPLLEYKGIRLNVGDPDWMPKTATPIEGNGGQA